MRFKAWVQLLSYEPLWDPKKKITAKSPSDNLDYNLQKKNAYKVLPVIYKQFNTYIYVQYSAKYNPRQELVGQLQF